MLEYPDSKDTGEIKGSMKCKIFLPKSIITTEEQQMQQAKDPLEIQLLWAVNNYPGLEMNENNGEDESMKKTFQALLEILKKTCNM